MRHLLGSSVSQQKERRVGEIVDDPVGPRLQQRFRLVPGEEPEGPYPGSHGALHPGRGVLKGQGLLGGHPEALQGHLVGEGVGLAPAHLLRQDEKGRVQPQGAQHVAGVFLGGVGDHAPA